MKYKIFIVFILISLSLSSQIVLFSDFENGNVELLSLDNHENKIIFRPSLKNEFNTTRCWFNFGITGFDTTRPLIIECIYILDFIAPEYPVYSYDQKTWHRLKANKTDSSKIVKYKFTKDTVYFAAGYPYTYSDVLFFVDSIASSPYIDTNTLVISEGNRKVPMFIIQDTSQRPTDLVWIIGRQHAFETTMNYTLEGMIDFLISDNEKAVNIRKKTVFYVVPMMDVDNVATGASGRMQRPVDFNRDWSINPYWKAVKEVQQKIKETNKMYNYRIFLDVHSTYPGAERPIFGIFNEYKSKEKEYKKMKTFFKLFYKNTKYNLNEISGKMEINYSDTYNAGVIIPEIKVSDFSCTIECDWGINHNGNPLTIEELKKVGRFISETLCDYLY